MAMYSMRSERAFCERLNYDMLFKWFLDLPIDAASFDASTFSKNRQRLLDADVADEFFAAVVRQAKLRRYISSDHFSVDGTLLEAWASHKSFKPKDSERDGDDGPKGRNAEVEWHGQKRSNDTHASTTDPDARLYRKSNNTAAQLCYAGHLLIEHRSALIVDAELTAATGYAERDSATDMLKRLPKSAGDEPWLETRTTTRRTSSLTYARLGSLPTLRRTPPTAGPRSTDAPPDTPATTSANGSETGRGTLRLGQDRRSRTQAALHRQRPQPGLVQDDHRRLQPHPHHRPRRSYRLMGTTARPQPPHRGRPSRRSPRPDTDNH